VRKKLEKMTAASTGVKGFEQNVQQVAGTDTTLDVMDNNPQLEGSELFSFFTANIIKEEKVFTR
jgi:hypothetical protein